MSRPVGWYWVKFGGEWTTAYYDGDVHYPWSLCQLDGLFDEEDLEEVGERITPPESFSGNE